MADLINVGTFPNDATGDPARTAFIKINGLAAGTIPFGQITVGPPVSGAAIIVNSISAGTAVSLTDGTVSGQINFNAASMQMGTSTNHPFSLYTNNLTRLIVAAAGNVNILSPTGAGPALAVHAFTGSAAINAIGDGATTAFIVNAGPATTIAQFDSTNAGGGLIVYTRANSQKGFLGDSSLLDSGTIDDITLRSNAGLGLTSGGSARRITINSTGNVTVNAPSSGVPLTVTGNGAAQAFTFLGAAASQVGAFDSTNASGPFVVFTRSAAGFGHIGNSGALGGTLDNIALRGQTGIDLITNGGAHLAATFASAGNLTIAAPTSGTALTITGVSAGRCIQANASGANFAIAVTNGTAPGLYLDNTSGGAGTPALRIDVSSTTGAATPTGLGTVKPGAATAASAWLPITLNGTLFYIPCWL